MTVSEHLGEVFHLHIHSEYSLLDGSSKVKKIVKELAARGASAAALTDHDALHGAIEFYLACKDAKIKPILGFEANLPPLVHPQKKLFHIVLLAENNAGYKNLIKLCSFANTTGKDLFGPDSIAITWEFLKSHKEGLICLTSCLKGELQSLLFLENENSIYEKEFTPKSENIKLSRNLIQILVSIFGQNNLYVELIDNKIPIQKNLFPTLNQLAQEFNIGCVATSDAHYLKPSEKDSHLSLLAIKHKLQKTDVQSFPDELEFHLRTQNEMEFLFEQYPQALTNTKVIAQRCHVDIDTKSVFMPDYRQFEWEPGEDCIIRLSREGLQDRKPSIRAWIEKLNSQLSATNLEAHFLQTWEQYETRLEYELTVINNMKFAGYFLIVQDFINWAKKQNIPVGPGRGSAAGSLVTYCLRITNIDPIRFNLLFERFLNPERISMPDIDTDFCQYRRNEVLNYVYERYGKRNVSQIVTFGRLMAKAAVKGLARISGWRFFESNEFAKLIPDTPGVTLETALKESPKLALRVDREEKVKNLWEGAVQIEGVLNSLGVHAAGVIISDRPLDDVCPLIESEGVVITQFEHKYAEKVGLIKFDFLGLKTLTVIAKTVSILKNLRGLKSFDIEDINLDDENVYKMISTAHVTGVFQLESNGMRKLIADLKPTCFTDVVAVLALFRPGPLGSGMVEDFVKRKHGENRVEYLFPELEPILQDTYGVIVYQEQVQKIAAVLASYTLGEADLLRRAMGKKDKNEMDKQKSRFVAGAVKNGHASEKSENLFDLMAKFAEYGFNKSHTAAYGWVTYQTAYLKTYFSAEFLCGILSCDLDSSDKVYSYLKDCHRLGIKVLPPCVNFSQYEFSVVENKPKPMLRFGLGAIKGLGEGSIELIVKERNENGPFESVPEFIVRLDARKLNKKIMESLIKSGSFDELNSNRNELLQNFESWLRTLSREAERHAQVGFGLFEYSENPKSKTLNLLAGIRTQNYQPMSVLEDAENEKNVFGFYFTKHPAEIFKHDFNFFADTPISKISYKKQNQRKYDRNEPGIKIAGLITSFFERTSKDGNLYCVFKLESDCHSEIELNLFSQQYVAMAVKPQIGELVLCEIQVSQGIEEGSVRGKCLTFQRLADLRAERAQSFRIQAYEEIFLDNENYAKNQAKLVEVLKKHPGKLPCSLHIKHKSEAVDSLLHLKECSVHPSDELMKQIYSLFPKSLAGVCIYTDDKTTLPFSF
jgi:DNA polymerase III subunit alpha